MWKILRTLILPTKCDTFLVCPWSIVPSTGRNRQEAVRNSQFHGKEMIKIELSKEYILLFNTLTDTAQALARLRTELMLAQQQAEELFLSAEDDADAPSET